MKKSRVWWTISLIGALLFLTVGGFFFHIYQVEPAFSEMVYEYGEHVSNDVEDYIRGSEWSVGLGELDLSEVDESSIGIYSAYVYHGNEEFRYSIEIRDTVAPEILLREEQVYLAWNESYSVEQIIAGVEDADANASVYFMRDGILLEEILLTEKGQHTLTLIGRDGSGNENLLEIAVIVDSAPVLSGVQRYYLVPNSVPDYLAAVTAMDETDGDLTAQIVVDDTAVNLSEEGEYVLCYEVADFYGLKTSAETIVTVAKATDIQELIGHRQISYLTDVIMGAPNIYDAGAADEEDIAQALADMRTTFVHLYHESGRGGYSSGSGYIMEITDDKIYICTNRHVVTKYENWDIYFFDGTKVPGMALGAALGYDVGVAVVETEDVPEELLKQLKTVHIDQTYWQSLDEEPIDLGLERLDRNGGTLHAAVGKLIKVQQRFEWYDRLDHTEVTVELVHGDSGSAVVDGYGNLICMAYAYSTEPIRYWCIPLDQILECYRQITGRVPYVY